MVRLKKQLFNKTKGWIKQTVTRCICKKKQEVVHILHIRKTGGSAVKESLGPYTMTDKFRIKLHGHSFTLKDVPKGEKVVFFLRDPFTRFVSGFYSRKRKNRW